MFPRYPNMWNLLATVSVISQMTLCGTSSIHRELPAEHQQAHPMDIVLSAEEIVREHGMRPTSVLFLDFGSILTRGSFRTDGSLLSMWPEPFVARIPVLTLGIHLDLWLPLAAPLKIIVVVSQDVWSENLFFFRSDSFQNIRHKFLFLLATRTEVQDRTVTPSLRFEMNKLPMVIWSGDKPPRWSCFENRDNLFWEPEPKSMGACDIEPTQCKAEEFIEILFQQFSTTNIGYTLVVKCNTTRAQIYYTGAIARQNDKNLGLFFMSLLFIWDPRVSACRTLIPSVAVDITALAKPFEREVWCSIIAMVLFLAVAWSLMQRKSALIFFSELSLSVITTREVTMVPKHLSGTMLGCTAVAFILLVGKLYSNTVMSSFLAPTSEVPPPIPTALCHSTIWCFDEELLNLILSSAAACDIPKAMLTTLGRPLRRFTPIGAQVKVLLGLNANMLESSKRGLSWLQLVPTQTSMIFDRIFQHGIISQGRLFTHEEKVSLSRRARPGMKRGQALHNRAAMAVVRAFLMRTEKLPFEAVEYNKTTEQFDTDRFMKILPLIWVCLGLVIGAICAELSYGFGYEIRVQAFALPRIVRRILSASLEKLWSLPGSDGLLRQFGTSRSHPSLQKSWAFERSSCKRNNLARVDEIDPILEVVDLSPKRYDRTSARSRLECVIRTRTVPLRCEPAREV